MTTKDKYIYIVKNYGRVPLEEIIKTTGIKRTYLYNLAKRFRKAGVDIPHYQIGQNGGVRGASVFNEVVAEFAGKTTNGKRKKKLHKKTCWGCGKKFRGKVGLATHQRKCVSLHLKESTAEFERPFRLPVQSV